MSLLPATPAPCGSWRVTRYSEGVPMEAVWCGRIEGACPFPGSDCQTGTQRRCATEPGTVLRVSWADACINESLFAMHRFHDAGISPTSQEIQVAIDALRACGAETGSE